MNSGVDPSLFSRLRNKRIYSRAIRKTISLDEDGCEDNEELIMEHHYRDMPNAPRIPTEVGASIC
jgi:hypothetical protein